MVEGAEAAVVVSCPQWKEVVRGKIGHHRSRGRGKSGLALTPVGLERAAKAARELEQSRKCW